MVAEGLPTKSSTVGDSWNAPLKTIKGSKERKDSAKCKFTEEPDPWKHPANQQAQEPYHLPGVGVMDINPTPPWKQPVQPFTIDGTLLTHAKPEGYPALPDVQLRQLPGYLWKVKWTHVPSNIAYWYSLKFRAGYNAKGTLGGGNGTLRPVFHYIVGVSLIGYLFHVVGMYQCIFYIFFLYFF